MKIELDGVKSLISKLNKVDRKVTRKADDLIAAAAVKTAGVAKMRLQPHPEDGAKLSADIAAVRQSINFEFDVDTHTGSVFAGNVTGDHMAAYLAFGTGDSAKDFLSTVPEPFPKMAMQFWKNGKGTLKVHDYFVGAYLQEGEKLKDKLKNLKVGW